MAHHLTRKSFKTQLRDRAKHSAKLNALTTAKKGGAGGKGVWGAPGSELNYSGVNDPRDPNYEDPTDILLHDTDRQNRIIASFTKPPLAQHHHFIESIADFDRFKQHVKAALYEWLQSRDDIEFKQQLDDIDMSLYHTDLPCILIRASFDFKTNEQRQIVFQFIAALEKSEIITKQHIEQSLHKLFDRLDDLQIDTPHAKQYIKDFAYYCIQHQLIEQLLFDDCLKEYEQLHDGATLQELKQRYQAIVDEMFRAQCSFEEACDIAYHAAVALHAPYTHYEFIKRMIRTSIDRSNKDCELTSLFIAHYTDDALIQHAQVEKAFQRLLQQVEDIYLDCKDVLHFLSIFIYRAVLDDVLPPAFLVRADLHAKDLGAQVLRHAKQLYDEKHSAAQAQTVWGFNLELLQEETERK